MNMAPDRAHGGSQGQATCDFSTKQGATMEGRTIFWIVQWIILFAMGIIAAGMWGCPQYNVYSQRLHGEAELARAHSARQVLVQQAQAEKDAALFRAEAIAIVGKAAKDYPEFRQQEFIAAFGEALHQGKIDQIIYVPTEANIPILEAKRLAPEQKK